MRILLVLYTLLCMCTFPAQAESGVEASLVYVTSQGSYTPIVRHPTKRTIAVCLGKTPSYIWVPDVLINQGGLWLRCNTKGKFEWSQRPFSEPARPSVARAFLIPQKIFDKTLLYMYKTHS